MKKTKEEYMAEALLNLKPNSEWVIRHGGETLEWLSPEITPPTQSEIDTEVARLEAEYDAQEYQRQRAVTYWPLADQLDALYWDKKHGTNIWEQHIEAVKNKFPKP